MYLCSAILHDVHPLELNANLVKKKVYDRTVSNIPDTLRHCLDC